MVAASQNQTQGKDKKILQSQGRMTQTAWSDRLIGKLGASLPDTVDSRYLKVEGTL